MQENGFGKWAAKSDDPIDRKSKHKMKKKFLSDMLLFPARIDNFARKGFPTVFIAFICIYWVKISLAAG